MTPPALSGTGSNSDVLVEDETEECLSSGLPETLMLLSERPTRLALLIPEVTSAIDVPLADTGNESDVEPVIVV